MIKCVYMYMGMNLKYDNIGCRAEANRRRADRWHWPLDARGETEAWGLWGVAW